MAISNPYLDAVNKRLQSTASKGSQLLDPSNPYGLIPDATLQNAANQKMGQIAQGELDGQNYQYYQPAELDWRGQPLAEMPSYTKTEYQKRPVNVQGVNLEQAAAAKKEEQLAQTIRSETKPAASDPIRTTNVSGPAQDKAPSVRSNIDIISSYSPAKGNEALLYTGFNDFKKRVGSGLAANIGQKNYEIANSNLNVVLNAIADSRYGENTKSDLVAKAKLAFENTVVPPRNPPRDAQGRITIDTLGSPDSFRQKYGV